MENTRQLRCSRIQDVPRLKELWKLAFGDEDTYIDHFFERYYTPERMLVLEECGAVQAMTAWFDMPVVSARGEEFPSAYLYAVATHPDCRGRGLAGQLLSFADGWLKERGFVCVTTVPARPDLHLFFGQNGFTEQFSLMEEGDLPRSTAVPASLERVDARTYDVLREKALDGLVHAACSPAALDYQAGVCALSGGGLYRIGERGCACVELAGDEAFIKELLIPKGEREAALAAIARTHPARRYHVRTPYAGTGEKRDFAMIKWLVLQPEWSGRESAYLGLAFD